MISRKQMVAAWLAFLATGTFFSLVVPLGEGIDEPAHFAYTQYIAQVRRFPLGHSQSPSVEIDAFLRAHPAGWSLSGLYSSLRPHDEYWKQSPQDREVQDRVVAHLRFSGSYMEPAAAAIPSYESHQPPLYYALTAPVFLVASQTFSFVDTFLASRIWSVLLASLVIPGAFLLARNLLKQVAAAEGVLLLMVLFPGLYPGIVRVSNDALALPVACWILVCLISYLETNRSGYLYGLSLLIVAGLWTKAFFIPVFVATVVTLLGHRKFRAAGTVSLISLLGWPWYAFALFQTGTLTGLPETIAAKPSIGASLQALLKLDWNNAINVLRSTHIWIGNSSLLGVRSWMYPVLSWFFALGCAGMLLRPKRGILPAVLPLIVSYVVFGAALAYYATQVFLNTGTSVIQGWYLTMFIPVEATLFVAGAREWFRHNWNWLVGTLALFLLGLLIYSTAFVALPYYSGFTSHNASGHVTTFHPGSPWPEDFLVMTRRLLRFHPSVPTFLPWLLFGGTAVFGFYGILRITVMRR